jgi:hypothetical protein
MADLNKQCICVKFHFKCGKTTSKTHEMRKTASGDNDMRRTQTFEWFSTLKHGETSVEDCERSGHPSTSRTSQNVVNVRKIINKN